MQVKQSTNQSSAVTELAVEPGEYQQYSITNKRGTRLTACNLGATVMSLMVKDKQGKLVDVVLGYDHPADYEKDEFYIGSVVGRYANRISGEDIQIEDRQYKISVKEAGYHLHGGKIGFNKKIFAAAISEEQNKSSILFRYTSPHLEEGFPGELKLEVIYTLDDEDAWTIEYRAATSKPTIINLTQHSYFNLSGNPADAIDNHELQINAPCFLPVDSSQVPTGKMMPVQNTVFDFTTFKTVLKDLYKDDEQLKLSGGYDHSFVLEKEHTQSLKHAAAVRDAGSGIEMNVYTTEPAVHFYAGNFLENIKGKKGIVYNRRAGLCLETQHFPDSPNHPHFPSTVLKPGETFYSKTVFKFSIE